MSIQTDKVHIPRAEIFSINPQFEHSLKIFKMKTTKICCITVFIWISSLVLSIRAGKETTIRSGATKQDGGGMAGFQSIFQSINELMRSFQSPEAKSGQVTQMQQIFQTINNIMRSLQPQQPK